MISLATKSVAPSQEEGGSSEHKEHVKQQVLALVRLEREVGHAKSAVDHVDTTAAGVETAEVPEVSGLMWCVQLMHQLQEPPELLKEMEDRLKALMEENFDPCSHPSVRELMQVFSGDGGEGNGCVEEGEEDVQVERVCAAHHLSIVLQVCVCESGPAVAQVSTDRDLSGGPSQQ